MADQNGQRTGIRATIETDVQASAPTSPKANVSQSKVSAEPTPVSRTSAPRPRVESAPQVEPPAPKEVPAIKQEKPVVQQEAPAIKSAPRASVVVEPAPDPQPTPDHRPVSEAESQPEVEQPRGEGPQSNEPAKKGPAVARVSVSGWVHRTFPGHEHAFWGGVIALLVALLVFAIGILRVIFIGALIIVGVAIGQAVDGDPKMINAVRNLIDGERKREY